MGGGGVMIRFHFSLHTVEVCGQNRVALLIVCRQVVSLLHYDDAEQGTKVDPSPGYPLVCINVSMAGSSTQNTSAGFQHWTYSFDLFTGLAYKHNYVYIQ